ncbi:MMPL family transporter [Haliscomenobacter sp.]|uniref:efflux RND transporter permease subunit n=1 Tax=Haliscomenobacter sp. TaxID=2717303 RepID=UPI0033652E61
MSTRFRIVVLSLFAVLSILSVRAAFNIRFAFDFEQFFPIGDPDLEAFKEFVKEFETDDNFLLVALHRPEGVFDQEFLQKVHQFSLDCRDLPHVKQVLSLTKIGYPIKTPFAITSIPAIHLDRPELYASDKARLLKDERFVRNLISEDAKTLVVYLKNIESIELSQARELIKALDATVKKYQFKDYHYLGRPYFQQEMVRLQQKEIVIATLVSAILVTLAMYFVFRRFWGTAVAVVSMLLGLLLFVGFLGGFVRELNTLSALYPVLVLIIGTSDIVHIMSKYNDELHKGHARDKAMWNTIRDVGLATFMTALTTAIGFASLVTNRVMPIKDFGINAAVGVMIAYFTVILFTTVMLTWFRADQIAQPEKEHAFWERLLQGIVDFTRNHPRAIVLTTIGVCLLSLLGISKITTNYDIISNLPRNSKIKTDFLFFEKHLAGFRPMEFAIFIQGKYRADDFEVLREMEKIEKELHKASFIQAIFSSTALYKSINQMYHNNRVDAYRLPESKEEFESYRRAAKRLPQFSANVLVSKDGRKARITSRVSDIGADNIKAFGNKLERWIDTNIDSTIIQVRRTGTGLIMDKNSAYIRSNLLLGLFSSIGLISLIIAFVLRSFRMMVIFLLPNFVPLLVAGALLGYWGVELDAGISIVFSVVFGIAVDDTIHFLSKFKLELNQGHTVEEALRVTLLETGKALILTTVFLFFGFLVLLFSQHPTSVVIGLLTSITLMAGMVTELMLAPVLVRWLIK